MDSVFASELSLSGSCLDGVLLDDHSEVDLLWCCLPMDSRGTNEKIMSSCLGPAGSHIMNDRTLPAIFTPGNGQKEATGSNHFVFVDNLGVFGVGKASVRDRLSHACESFDKRGLKTHEQEVQSGIVTCLGNQLDCVEHRSSPTDMRFWRLKRALEYALSVKRLPGTHLGGNSRTLHLSWCPGAGCLSTFFTIYQFIRKSYYTSEPLWDSVREELVCFLGLMYFLQSSWRLLWSPIVAASDERPSGYALCIGKWPHQKVAQHGRVLERSRFKRNPGSSARDSFSQADDFVKGADGLWHPRVEEDQPAVNSVWSQVTDFLEVELRLLQKRDWHIVFGQTWKFGDDILLCEACALFRGLLVMVCAEHVRNARILCLTDSMSCALAFERRRARNFKLLVQIRKLTSLCLCHQIKFHVRWMANESNCCDDPSKRHDMSQHGSHDFSNNLFDSPTPFCADESLNDGDEGAMLARPTESVLVEPENSSRGGAHKQQHKHPLQDAETSVYQQDGVPGEYWNGHERVGEGQIRCDESEETATYRQPHSDDGQTFRKIHLLPGSSRSEKLRSLPPGLARVPPAHFGGRKPACRGCRGRRGTRGLLQREISSEVQ